jgi:phage shock protein E
MIRFTALFLLLGFLFMQYGCAQNQPANAPGTYQSIDLVDFDQILLDQPQAILLDVRTPEETALGKIEGAIELDFSASNFEQHLQRLDKQATYIVYCRSGVRSEKAANMMAGQGCRSVYNFRGGFNAWKEAGR